MIYFFQGMKLLECQRKVQSPKFKVRVLKISNDYSPRNLIFLLFSAVKKTTIKHLKFPVIFPCRSLNPRLIFLHASIDPQVVE